METQEAIMRFYDYLYQTDPNFRDHVEKNKDKTWQQLAQEYHVEVRAE